MRSRIEAMRRSVPAQADLSHISPDLQDKAVLLDDLLPDPDNANTHGDENLLAIQGSLGKYRQVLPLVVNLRTGQPVIVGGNGTWQAARKLREKDPRWNYIAVTLGEWSHSEAMGLALALNRSAQLAQWDRQKLVSQLDALEKDGLQVSDIGFSADYVQSMLDSLQSELKALGAMEHGEGFSDLPDEDADADPDDDGEENDKPAGGQGSGQEDGKPASDGSLLALVNVTVGEPEHTVERGQIWHVGPHLLICCDVLAAWEEYVPLLVELRRSGAEVLLTPYPGPFIPLTLRADKYRLLMVQPDPYIAGHILDQYARVRGDEHVSLRP